ncbi:MAG: hypothetical protein ABIH21_03455, partial [Patescibacteria group bacterium]
PQGESSAGCVFKNYEVNGIEELEELKVRGVPKDMLDKGQVSAGWIVDHLDLKGYSIGDAQVSKTHGNFIVNRGNATADEIMQLIAFIQTRARNEMGIQLQEEVQLVGFD